MVSTPSDLHWTRQLLFCYNTGMSSRCVEEVVASYCRALDERRFRVAASLIDPQDRVDFHQQVMQALAHLEKAGFDHALVRLLGRRDRVRLAGMTAEEFLAEFLAQAMTGMPAMESEILQVRLLDDERAEADFRVAQITSSLQLRQGPYGWRVRLREGLSQVAAQAEALTADFLQRAARDRPSLASQEMTPFALYGYRDSQGNIVLEPRFEAAEEFQEGLAAVQVHGRWGFVDRQGRMRIPIRYLSVTSFSSGRAWACELTDDFRRIWRLLDPQGNQLECPPVEEAYAYSEGLSAACLEGLWGYLDTSGRWSIAPRFSEASSFYEGEARVSEQETVYWINPRGQRLDR